MSTWASNIQWDDSIIKSLTGSGATTQAPVTPTITTTAAPETEQPITTTFAPVPTTTSPPYQNNPGFGSGSGGVVFPLPVAPSLLMDGDISALNPITDAPTTMAPTTMPPTLAPMPMGFMTTAPPVDNTKKYMLYGFGGVIVIAALVFAWKKGVFKKMLK